MFNAELKKPLAITTWEKFEELFEGNPAIPPRGPRNKIELNQNDLGEDPGSMNQRFEKMRLYGRVPLTDTDLGGDNENFRGAQFAA